MISDKEREIVLLLFKDFSASYNARSISSKVGMTPRGALKALKSLEKQGYVAAKPFGRAIEYKFAFGSSIARKAVEFFLLEEAELGHKRWLAEFSGLAEAFILVLFGSAARKRKDFNDVDLVVVVKESAFKSVQKAVEEKQKVMAKRVHAVWQSPDDLLQNLKKGDSVMLSALREGVVLKGQAELVEVVLNVARS